MPGGTPHWILMRWNAVFHGWLTVEHNAPGRAPKNPSRHELGKDCIETGPPVWNGPNTKITEAVPEWLNTRPNPDLNRWPSMMETLIALKQCIGKEGHCDTRDHVSAAAINLPM